MTDSLQKVTKSFSQFRFFETFSEQLIEQVARFARYVVFEDQQEILKQGQLNNLLFFVESGEVEIQVDHESVAHLSQRGEVLGEMSVISHMPVSASVIARGTVNCFVINVEDFTKVKQEDSDHFLFLLHKIYSVVVTDRLRSTNRKARDFEITNRELLKAKQELESLNSHLEAKVDERTQELKQTAAELKASYAQLEQKSAALSAGYKKVTDLSKFRDEAIKRIKDITDLHVGPLFKVIQRIVGKSVSSISQDLTEAQTELESLRQEISKLIDWDAAERAIDMKRVLLVDSDRKQQLIAKMALGGTGVTLEIADDPEIALGYLSQNPHDLIFCSAQHSDVLRLAHEKDFKGPMVLFTSNEVQSYLPIIKSLPFVENVVSRDPSDRTFTVKNIVTTITKILNEDFFGLEKYLSWGADVRMQDIDHSTERERAIQEMQDYLKTLGVRASILDRCGICAEEMLMNAIYDAPTDANGSPLFNHLQRTVEISLTREQASHFRYACDGNLVAVSVQDPFGALMKSHVIDYLETCYQGQAGILNKHKGGAGRGLHQIIENSDLTIFNVKKGVRTEVISLFNIESNSKKELSQPTFHYFFS